jgi:hypothetical protein
MASFASHVVIGLDIDVNDDIGVEVRVVEELRKHGLGLRLIVHYN